MSVSLYYSARRDTPLSPAESDAVQRIVTARGATYPYDDEEGLYLYEPGEDDPDEVLAGCTKFTNDPARYLPQIRHLLGSMTELRRAVPDAEWRVAIDDSEIEWEEPVGYTLPGLDDPDLQAELEAL
ncbi:hypothetical protein [Streptomyces sp. BE147]|uniref:hypothetical protein n=1 Tax=unclassified Streptomyces TaxID=2593676 RepID=UPI002E788DD9|nr:hypothetical protein [Streptomyces sp. BE147]MEE1737561.1 hypothetical protein [Streptomyces sp. BE147]